MTWQRWPGESSICLIYIPALPFYIFANTLISQAAVYLLGLDLSNVTSDKSLLQDMVWLIRLEGCKLQPCILSVEAILCDQVIERFKDDKCSDPKHIKKKKLCWNPTENLWTEHFNTLSVCRQTRQSDEKININFHFCLSGMETCLAWISSKTASRGQTVRHHQNWTNMPSNKSQTIVFTVHVVSCCLAS